MDTPKKKFEEIFVEHLKTLLPDASCVKLFRAVVLDIWKTNLKRFDEEGVQIQARIERLKQDRQRIFGLHRSGVYDDQDFSEQKRLVGGQLVAQYSLLEERRTKECDMEKIMDSALGFVTNATETWLALADNYPARIRFQNLLFLEKLPFDGKRFGTAKMSPILGVKKSRKNWLVTLSTFPPRACGLADYASWLTEAVGELYAPSFEIKVIAMNRGVMDRFRYPREVIFQVNQQRVEDYAAAAAEMNTQERVSLVHIQHEFGIFGGEFGSHLLTFTEACKKPIAITFHTVLPDPSPSMRDVVRRLGASVGRIIVMTQLGKRLLCDVYGLPEERIDVIPHGIPSMSLRSSTRFKIALGIGNRTTLLTFGLLSRNKGIEYVIDALPEVVKSHPDALYVIVGVTHPDVMRREGEAYRNSLEDRVQELGLTSHVLFYNEFVSPEELPKFLQAADIYVATSLDPNQAVSGTLSFAMGSGRPVISTAFAQAQEIVTPDVGILVDFRNPGAYAQAILRLLGDKRLRSDMGREAYFRTRKATWPNAALATGRTYAALAPGVAETEFGLPPIKLGHVESLTDDFGMFQFARLHVPDPASGYTVDDNARALLAMTGLYEKFETPAALPLTGIYLHFLATAALPGEEFSNYIEEDRSKRVDPDSKENAEDAKGRAFRALAHTASSSAMPERYRRDARTLVDAYLATDPMFGSPRAGAFLIDGLHALWRQERRPEYEAVIRRHCEHLADTYRDQRADGWEWFEPTLTYANSTLSEALLLGGKVTGEAAFTELGKKTLDFLVAQTFVDGMYVAIGQNCWQRQGGERSYFDQQPEDVAAMVRTLTVRAEIEPEGNARELRQRAFEWFLGRNMLGQTMYARATGGCYDGMREASVNLNQGAESTVSYLLARLTMET